MSDWVEEMHEGLDGFSSALAEHEDKLADVSDRLIRLEKWVENHDETCPITSPGATTLMARNASQDDEMAMMDQVVAAQVRQPDVEAAKAAARQAVEQPDPLPEKGDDSARSPSELVNAILSNLTLCIQSETLDEAVRFAKQAQRLALCLKRKLKD